MSMQEAFIDELRDTYDAEKQLIKALTKMAKAASDPKLSQAFQSHLAETRGQVARLEEVFGLLGEKVRGKHCDGIAGIIEEGNSKIEEEDGAILDACLVGAGQRAEHYEMAAYGTLMAWAKTLDYADVIPLLEANLNEEKAADEKLSALAEGGINQRAASEPEEEESGSSRGRSSKKSSGRKGGSSARKASGGRASGGRRAAAKKAASRGGSSKKSAGRGSGNKSGRASGSGGRKRSSGR